MVADEPVGEENEGRARECADRGPPDAAVSALQQQARAGAEHHTRRDRVRGAEPAARAAASEREGQGPEARSRAPSQAPPRRRRLRSRRAARGAGRDERPARARPRPAAPPSPDARHRARGGAAPGTGRATCPRLPSAPGRQCRTHAAIARRVARGRSFGRAPGGPCGALPEQEQRARSSIQMLRGGARGGIGAVPDLRLGLLLMPLAFEQNPHIAATRASSAVGTIRV